MSILFIELLKNFKRLNEVPHKLKSLLYYILDGSPQHNKASFLNLNYKLLKNGPLE